MKKTNPPLFDTGICESTHSKRTIVSLLTGLKTRIPATIHVVSRDQVILKSFNDIVTESGCIYFRGASIKGQSLYDLYVNYGATAFENNETKRFLQSVIALIDTSMKYSNLSGGYPVLLLNSIYVTDDASTVTYLSYSLMDYLNTFYDDDTRQVIYYPAMMNRSSGMKSRKHIEGRNLEEKLVEEHTYNQFLARLMYLFFTKFRRTAEEHNGKSGFDGRIYYLKTEMNDIPRSLADTIWDTMRGKQLSLDSLREAIVSASSEKPLQGRTEKIPFGRKRNVLTFRIGIAGFLSRRWKLVVIALIIFGVALYLFSDALKSRKREDYTAGLQPRQVVELYYEAINNLDLDVVEAIYYRRAGKTVRDELSTVYVMLKMEGAFGKRFLHPDELAEDEFQPHMHTVFGIRDLELELVQDGSQPLFRAEYLRVISSGEKLHTTEIVEMIQLQYIDNHWYITKSDRTIESRNSPMQEDQ